MFTKLLISLCDIQSKSIVNDEYEPEEVWVDVATDVPTRKDRTNSPKISDNEQRENNDDDLFFFDADVSISRGNRIKFDEEYYDVIKVNKSYDSKAVHHLEVTARLTDND